jgi:hypothetical protein
VAFVITEFDCKWKQHEYSFKDRHRHLIKLSDYQSTLLCIVCCFVFQLQEDPYNEDAHNGLIKVEPIREDISLAKAFVRGRDYKAAIELITKIIEVSCRK